MAAHPGFPLKLGHSELGMRLQNSLRSPWSLAQEGACFIEGGPEASVSLVVLKPVTLNKKGCPLYA